MSLGERARLLCDANRGGTSVGGKTTGSSLATGDNWVKVKTWLWVFFSSGAFKHIGLLQHKVLPIENCGHAPEALIFAHHEALEEGNHKHGDEARAAAANCTLEVLPTSSQGSKARGQEDVRAAWEPWEPPEMSCQALRVLSEQMPGVHQEQKRHVLSATRAELRPR